MTLPAMYSFSYFSLSKLAAHRRERVLAANILKEKKKRNTTMRLKLALKKKFHGQPGAEAPLEI